ncbi:regulatory protein TetR [Pseudofrankia inefficax]|uniref:Regulatory protein TetR n=1 Tax=Pseudofrankia inefficax (strain DSM 45817 / CECT 9037 / DDB 130130 / EuI1c) TaxID=298654 RepID=E3J5K8_PSEI1|nr:TetR family transcriptional regulator [Pseudofrankia inefficax]ADP83095.1 regulatory protein TetR [Pseudofrankia inefficax]
MSPTDAPALDKPAPTRARARSRTGTASARLKVGTESDLQPDPAGSAATPETGPGSGEQDPRTTANGPAPRAADGRVPGRRGLATRARLLECAATMLESTPYRELTVTDISREAGTSPATFYQYFVDMETAMLVLAEQVADQGAQLSDLVGTKPWRGATGLRGAEALVDGFLSFWTTHQPVLRVVDLLTEEGDLRFRRARVRMLNAITRALAAVIEEAQTRAGRSAELEPMAMAGALVSMLAHVAAHQPGFESWDIHVSDLREAMVRLVFWGVTGPKVPRVL